MSEEAKLVTGTVGLGYRCTPGWGTVRETHSANDVQHFGPAIDCDACSRYSRLVLRSRVLLAVTVVAIATAPAAASILGRVFVSKRNGYTLRLPTRWTAMQTPGKWDGTLSPNAPGSDHFINNAMGIRSFVASRPAGGRTPSTWIAQLEKAEPASCPRSGRITTESLGGTRSKSFRFVCADGYEGRQWALIRRGRATAISGVWLGGTAAQPAAAAFRGLLKTLRFSY
jgi:hypothetical protein